MSSDINISIVLYKNSKLEVEKVSKNLLDNGLNIKLFLVDNSPAKELGRDLDHRIKYIFNNGNLGYGKAHNIIIKKSIGENTKYHLILNPDIYFEKNVIKNIYDFMEDNPDIGLLMPKVLYPNGNVQYLCKLLPSPLDLFGRRFFNWGLFKSLVERRKQTYELRFADYNKIMEVPYLSGCFMFIRTRVLKKIGLFDERFFMYPEDVDLSRRIHKFYKTIYYPKVSVFHTHKKGSYKSLICLYYHVFSMIKYYNKWGWFNDKERRKVNNKTLRNIKK